MTKIFLVSQTEEENHLLKRKVEPLMRGGEALAFVGVRPQLLPQSVDKDVSIVVLNSNIFNEVFHQAIVETRKIGYRGPILVLSKADSLEARTILRSLENVFFLEKPYQIRDLIGLMRKVLFEDKIAKRIHKRFATEQEAKVSFSGKSGLTHSTMLNLSKGGAFVLIPEVVEVKIGDQMTVTVTLDDVNKTYVMPCKAVWISPEMQPGETGVGVEFVGKIHMTRAKRGDHGAA